MSKAGALLDITDLTVGFHGRGGMTEVVRHVSLTVAPGETLAIVGESGSGKSVTSLAIMGLLQPGVGKILSGSMVWRTEDTALDLVTATPERIRALRGREIAMIFQEPMTSLNPVYTVGSQLAEATRLHLGLNQRAALDHAAEMLTRVGIPEPRRRLSNYPHELSGGMRQRVMIALALSCRPRLLIADEPTTALDVTIQAQILELIAQLKREMDMAVLFVTHDLGVVADTADRVAVMYGGEIVETGTTAEVLARPLHPYTIGLMASRPTPALKSDRVHRLAVLPGQVPDPRVPPAGCLFHPRCAAYRSGLCDRNHPPLEEAASGREVRCLRWREIDRQELMA